jgi:hypothetical protein
LSQHRSLALRRRAGTSAAELSDMTNPSKRPSEAWTAPLHVIMWTTMMVGFIMVMVVMMMR